MDNYSKRVFEVLVRTSEFAKAYPYLFKVGSLPAQLIDVIHEAVEKVSGHSTAFLSCNTVVRSGSNLRSAARDALRTQLEAIAQTARSMKLQGFWIPRNQSDMAVVETGKVFVDDAEKYKAELIENHLPSDFIEKLKLAVENLESASLMQRDGKRDRGKSGEALSKTRNQALDALRRLDTIMNNMLRDDSPMLLAWTRARHLEKPRRRKASSASDTTSTETAAGSPAPA